MGEAEIAVEAKGSGETEIALEAKGSVEASAALEARGSVEALVALEARVSVEASVVLWDEACPCSFLPLFLYWFGYPGLWYPTVALEPVEELGYSFRGSFEGNLFI